MKTGARLCTCLLPFVAALALVTIAIRSRSSLQTYTSEPNNNPHHFHMAFGTNYLDHTMTYDPRAADEWLFYTGGLIKTNRL